MKSNYIDLNLHKVKYYKQRTNFAAVYLYFLIEHIEDYIKHNDAVTDN